MSDAKPQVRARRILNRRNSVTIAAGIKLSIFTVVSVLVTGLLAAIMGNIGFGAGAEYRRSSRPPRRSRRATTSGSPA